MAKIQRPGNSELGKKIRLLRKGARLTTAALADSAGISRPYLTQIELGDVTSPSLEIVRGIAAALQVGVDELLGDQNQGQSSMPLEEVRRAAIALAQNPDLGYYSCHVGVLVSEMGDAKVTFDVDVWNLAEETIHGDFWKLWFESSATLKDAAFRVWNADTLAPIDYDVTTDFAHFKIVRLFFALKPQQRIRYGLEFRMAGAYVPPCGPWWEQEIHRRTWNASVDIRLPPKPELGKAAVRSFLENRTLELQIEKTDSHQLVHWEQRLPRIGNVYRISWEEERRK